MENVANGYDYTPLKVTTEIRLLTLCGDKEDNPVVCTLTKVDLASEPAYETPSYCWGSPEKKRYVEIHGDRVEVRENL